MAHGRLVFVMPAGRADAFEAFFNHTVRLRWDTLLSVNYVEGGGTHPYVGAVSTNRGRGWKTGLAMRTRFLSYDPPRQASAELVEPTGPFALWAASMRFKDRDDGGSDLIYTYSIRLRPAGSAYCSIGLPESCSRWKRGAGSRRWRAICRKSGPNSRRTSLSSPPHGG